MALAVVDARHSAGVVSIAAGGPGHDVTEAAPAAGNRLAFQRQSPLSPATAAPSAAGTGDQRPIQTDRRPRRHLLCRDGAGGPAPKAARLATRRRPLSSLGMKGRRSAAGRESWRWESCRTKRPDRHGACPTESPTNGGEPSKVFQFLGSTNNVLRLSGLSVSAVAELYLEL